jgi:YHS domain-containing protein
MIRQFFHLSALPKLPRLLIATVTLLLLAGPAWAGEFFEKDGVALRGYDAVAYFSDKKPVKGLTEHQAEYKGSTFHFASKQNRDAFLADPAKFAPQYGGFCAFGTAGGYKAATDPAAFTIVDGKLYLNYNRDIQKQWSADIPGLVVKANKNWPTVSSQTKVIE